MITLLGTSFTQCAEEEYKLPCVTDMISNIASNVPDLCTVSILLRTCTTYNNAYSKICLPKELAESSQVTQEDWAKVQFGINRLLQQCPMLCKNLDSNDHLNALVHYAQTNNLTMLEHIIKHENNDNRENRIGLLAHFSYLTKPNKIMLLDELFNIENNMNAYKAIAKNEHYINIEHFFNAEKLNLMYPLKIFLKNKIDINAKDVFGNTILQYASFHGYTNIAECLISHGADINARNCHNRTALHQASWNGHQDIVLLIIEKTDVNAQDNDGITALHCTCQSTSHQGHKHVVNLLLSHGANISAQDNNGTTPLHAASFTNRKEMVELLLSHDAYINAQNNAGATPLYNASFFGYTDIVELLLSHGADITIKDKNDHTALFWASLEGHKEIVELLEKADAEQDTCIIS